MNEVQKDRSKIAGQWIQALMYLGAIGLINSAADIIPFMPSEASYYISMGIQFSFVVSLFQLAPLHKDYRASAILRAVMFVSSIVIVFLKGAAILTFAVSISSIISVYLEYNAHAYLIKEKDDILARKWKKLFLWGIGSGVLLSFGSMVSVAMLSYFETDVSRITSIIVGILGIPKFLVQLVYVVYLNKMIELICEREVQ